MTFPTLYQISDLKETAVDGHLTSLLAKLIEAHDKREIPAWVKEDILASLIEVLDRTDDNDIFGTEGWRKFFS